MTQRPPKAKIVRAHKLADQLLGIYQSDIRPWLLATYPNGILLDDDLIEIVDAFRRLRIEVERPP